jgi:glycosyltransferase involved in cell wall biosynthesis
MKVLQIIDSLREGGKERQLIELLKAHQGNSDVTHTMVTMSENNHYLDICRLDLDVYKLIRKSKKDPRICRLLYTLCRRIKPDIIHSWESMCSIYAFPVCKLLGIKFINGFLRDAPGKLKMDIACRSKLTFPFSDGIVSNSYAGLKSYHVSPQKAVCIHNGFDFNRLNNLKEQNVVRNELDIKAKYVVGMVATFSNKKDYTTFIEVGLALMNRSYDVNIVAVGDGPTLSTCRSMIPDSNKKRFKFLGARKNVESIVNIFDIGVLATNESMHGEGISNSIMEYMALGKPVVATECGGNRELVVDGKTGLLVSSGCREELFQAIVTLIENPCVSKEMGKQGIERIKKHFSIEQYSQKYLEYYHNLINN